MTWIDISAKNIDKWPITTWKDSQYHWPSENCTLRPQFSSVQLLSCVLDSLQPQGLQHTRPPCPSPTPGVYSNSCPPSQWCHPPSHPLSSPSLPTFSLSQHQGLFQWVSSLHQVAKVLEFQLQHQSFQWIFRVIAAMKLKDAYSLEEKLWPT